MSSSVYLVLVLSLSLLVTLASTGMPGAPVAANTGSEEVKNAANFALERFNLMSTNKHIYKLLTVKSAKTQVVAGRNYILEIIIGATNCQKNSHYNLQACKLTLGANAKLQNCTFEVYVSWNNVMSLSKSTCKTL
ncbi:cystatin [Xenopus laevis]|uniref:Cystatin n=2 Tax=Xenopus laevis TaxID=8355 RepID=A0A1L8G7F5_XENLA|nr:cystatin [Xenopus laevis]XP_041418288.1 cystatin [Xenopus laevis]OCT79760.1 hypothetical protein XELAEV_18026570mg [Xenopus laevis]